MNNDILPKVFGPDFEKFLENQNTAAYQLFDLGKLNGAMPPQLSFLEPTGVNSFFPSPLPEAERADFGSLVTANAFLENVAGRAIAQVADSAGQVFAPTIETNPPITIDGKLTTDYTIDDYIKQNEEYFSSFPGGRRIIADYLTGSYDGLEPRQFIMRMGFDLAKEHYRNELAKEGEFYGAHLLAGFLGQVPDPVTLVGGNLVIKGGALALGLGKATASASATAAKVSLLQRVGTSIGEGAVQNVVRSSALSAIDPEYHSLEEFRDNLFFGLAIDSTRALGASLIRAAAKSGDGSLRQGLSNAKSAVTSVFKRDRAPVAEPDINLVRERISTAVDSIPDEAVDLHSAAARASVDPVVERVTTAKNDTSLFEDGLATEPAPVPTNTSKILSDIDNEFADRRKPSEAGSPSTPRPAASDGSTSEDFGTGRAASEAAPAASERTSNLDFSGPLTESDRELLIKIAKQQQQSAEVPLDEAAAREQLDKIASRPEQIFNYGRLDDMGLRKVKIEQPILQAFFQKIEAPEGFRLDALLQQLKRENLETKLAAIDAAGLNKALEFYKTVTGNDVKAAANAVLDLGKVFGERSQPPRLPGTTFDDLGNFRATPSDYFPDRANDAIFKSYTALKNAFNKWRGKETDTFSTEGQLYGTMSGIAYGAMRYETSDNPLDRAIFDIYSSGSAGIAMQGETSGRLNPLQSYESVRRFYGDKNKQTVQLALRQPFQRFILRSKGFFSLGNEGLGERILSEATSGLYSSPETRQLYSKFDEMVELLRIKRANDLNNAGFDRQPLLDPLYVPAEGVATDYSSVFNRFKDSLNLTDDSFKNLVKELDDVGALDIGFANNKKLTSWMGFQESRIVGNTTNLKINSDISLGQLNDVLETVFGMKKTIPSGADEFSQKYAGLMRFATEDIVDSQTGIRVKTKTGVFTRKELQDALANGTTADIVTRIVNDFNDSWGGLVPIQYIDSLYNKFDGLVRVSAEGSVNTSTRFLTKVALANSLYRRLKEFHALDYLYSSKGVFDPIKASEHNISLDREILYYQALRGKLTEGVSSAFDIATTFRNFTDFNEKALDSLINYNKDVYQTRLSEPNGFSRTNTSGEGEFFRDSLSDAERKQWAARTEDLRVYIKDRLGLSPSFGNIGALGDAALTSSQSLLLGTAGVNVLGEGIKAIANGLTLPSMPLFKSIADSLRYNLKGTALSKDAAGIILESLNTLQEDGARYVARLSEELADGGVASSKPSVGELARGSAHAWRNLISKASLIEASSDFVKRLGFYNEYHAAVDSKKGLLRLAGDIADLVTRYDDEQLAVRKGLLPADRATTKQYTPLEATRLVAKKYNLNPIEADNLYYNYNTMAGFFSAREMRAFGKFMDFVYSDNPDLNTSFEQGAMRGFIRPQELETLRAKFVDQKMSKSVLGRALFADDVDTLLGFEKAFREFVAAQEMSLGKATVEDLSPVGNAQPDVVYQKRPLLEFYKVPDIAINSPDLLRKFGRYLNYAIEQKNLNIPTAISDVRTNPNTFYQKLATQFVRTAQAQVLNTTWGSANRGLATRSLLFLLLGATGFTVNYLKAYLLGNKERFEQDLDTTAGLAKVVNQSLDYGGFLPIFLSKPLAFSIQSLSGNGLDRMSAKQNLIPAPLSGAFITFDAFVGAPVSYLQGEEITEPQRRALRKVMSLNLLDSTVARGITKGLEYYNGDDDNQLKDTLETIYGKPKK